MFGRKKNGKMKDNPSLKDRHQAFVCTVNGPFEMNIENYGTLGDYSDKKIVLHTIKSTIVIEGDRLLIDYFTDIDMKITGRIHSVHF